MGRRRFLSLLTPVVCFPCPSFGGLFFCPRFYFDFCLVKQYSLSYKEKKRVLVEHAYLACSFPISLEQLPSLPYLTYFKDPASQRLIENWWREHYPSPFPQGLTVKDGTICREMIFQGLGYSIFFTKGYMEDRPEYQMPLYHREGRPFTRSTWLIWQQSRCRSNILQEFIGIFNTQP